MIDTFDGHVAIIAVICRNTTTQHSYRIYRIYIVTYVIWLNVMNKQKGSLFLMDTISRARELKLGWDATWFYVSW